MIEGTSATLVRLVSSLVYGAAITKPSPTLAQCIQHQVGGTNRNQTTHGLVVKLHYKHGSSELVKTLNEHGITSSYNEVLRFRKSVAKFVSDNQSDYHKKLGLSMEIGHIVSWADNYDLYIAYPKGTKATHAMVMEFTQHPAGIIETGNIGVMQLTIPRLKKHEASSLRLTHQAIQLELYMGRSKQQAKDTGDVRSDDRLATCPPRHRNDNACIPPKDSECLVCSTPTSHSTSNCIRLYA